MVDKAALVFPATSKHPPVQPTMNQSCESSADLQLYQHCLYAVVYCVILAPGLLGNVLALWVFRVYVRETKKAVLFMMNLAVADLLQVKARHL